ncbi:MAG: FAD binding domain-containing protein [Anaerolineae bacterium]
MIKAYHRVKTLQEALDLTARPGIKTAVLYGYDAQVTEDTDEVVDLQAISLNPITVGDETAVIGALTPLQTIVEAETLPSWLRTLAQQAGPSTFRHMRTLGHLLTHLDSESLLLAALIATQVQVTVVWKGGETTVSIGSFLEGIEGIIVSVTVPLVGRLETAHVARTPADQPIVGAVAYHQPNGAIALVLTGVASLPVMSDPMSLDSLTPPSDFRGSAAYRKDMAAVLTRRVLAQLGVAE